MIYRYSWNTIAFLGISVQTLLDLDDCYSYFFYCFANKRAISNAYSYHFIVTANQTHRHYRFLFIRTAAFGFARFVKGERRNSYCFIMYWFSFIRIMDEYSSRSNERHKRNLVMPTMLFPVIGITLGKTF